MKEDVVGEIQGYRTVYDLLCFQAKVAAEQIR